jgi:hypothetical protein
MIWFLRCLFVVVLGSMLAITSWAGMHQSLSAFAHSATFRDPWVIATLFDAYWAFVAVFVWVAWKERSMAARVLWFVSLIALGNLAIAGYFLRELFSVPADGPLDPVLARRNPGRLPLPAALTALSVAVYAFA